MSLFEDLCADYAVWNGAAHNVMISFMRLPAQLAKALQVYLEAPETFTDFDGEKHKYVTTAVAKWNVGTSAFDLEIKERGLPDVELHTDGRFYFGIAVRLEVKSNSFPKTPMWILLSVEWLSADDMKVRIPATRSEFVLPLAKPLTDGVIRPIFEAIVAEMRDVLRRSPYDHTMSLARLGGS